MPTLMPRVTALVSTYNGERFLQGCLADLCGQTLFERDELEIIIIDSASPENEGAVALPFVRRYPGRVGYVRTEERETLYAAWNRGIAMARGEYLTNANVDDRHHPTMLERLAEVLDAEPAAAVAYADAVVTEDANASFESARPVRVERWPGYERESLFERCYIGQAPMWRRSLHATYGLFDAAMKSAGDYEFWLRLAAGGEQFIHLAEPLGLYLERPDALSLANLDLSWHESEVARNRHWKPAWGTPPQLRNVIPYLERLAARLQTFLASRGGGLPCAVFGGGKHTFRILPELMAHLPAGVNVVHVLDDQAVAGQVLHGVPVVRPAETTERHDVIIVSSDRHEQALYARAKQLFPAVEVWRLYAPEQE